MWSAWKSHYSEPQYLPRGQDDFTPDDSRWTSSSEGRPFRMRLKVRLGRCEGVLERLRLCMLGDRTMLRGEMGLQPSPLVSIMTTSPLSGRMGDE